MRTVKLPEVEKISRSFEHEGMNHPVVTIITVPVPGTWYLVPGTSTIVVIRRLRMFFARVFVNPDSPTSRSKDTVVVSQS
jgi:hypothetical protein